MAVITTNSEYIAIEEALELINEHQFKTKGRYRKLENYFIGKHDILNRTMEDSSKPNNKVVTNLPSHAVGIRVGYFSGEPLTITGESETETLALNDILEYNDFQDVNSDLDELSSIHGTANLVLWIDEEGFVRMSPLKPSESFVIYDNSIKQEPVGAVIYRQYTSNDQTFTEITLYNKDRIQYYKGDLQTPVLMGEEPNFFGDIPMVEFMENKHRKGSFEDAISIVDAIENIMSSSVNEIEYFDNAYLLLKNLSATEPEDIVNMKNNRTLLVDGDGDASFLTKSVSDTYIQNMLNRLTNDFHKLTGTPNLTDESFAGNASGVALSYKMFGLEKQMNKKESKWRKSIQRMIELIVNVLNMRGQNIDYRNYKITFTRALPQNVAETAQMVTSLNGIVSNETLLSLLPFIEKPLEELKRVNNEKEAMFETYAFPMKDEEPEDETDEIS